MSRFFGRNELAKHQVRKVAEREFPEFFKFLSRILPRILLRIFPEFFEDFSCFASWETETRKIHQKSPPFFNAKSPGKYEKDIHKMFLEGRQSKLAKHLHLSSVIIFGVDFQAGCNSPLLLLLGMRSLYRYRPEVFLVMFAPLVHIRFLQKENKQNLSYRCLVSRYKARLLRYYFVRRAPYNAIGFRGKFFLRYPPLLGLSWTAIGHFYGKK